MEHKSDRQLKPRKHCKRLVREKPSPRTKRTPIKSPKGPSRKTELTPKIIQAAVAEVDKTGKVPIYVGKVKLSFEDRLRVLEKRRDVGLWVQCSNSHCSKWRYIEDIKDPADVPCFWYCHMNKDSQFDACSKPEQVMSKEVEEDLIENKFTAGSIVWAKFEDYPYWPGMVEDDSNSLQFYELNAENPKQVDYYHVSFFDCRVSQAWVPAAFVHQFKDGNESFEVVQENHLKYTSRIEDGKKMALRALQMDITWRLQTFNALKRYYLCKKTIKKRHGSRKNLLRFADFNEDSGFESRFSRKDDYETDYEDNRTPRILSQSEENLNNVDNSVGLFELVSAHLKKLSRNLFGNFRKPF